ncbi:vacuolar iron transporter Ccc1 [Pochonia chlamydosporia 170]|uniref:Vacuolar iron transporter Ccc1 n=1 Tax=Pochonia chlamydosporia 170 TaxID=1380566 RepID=A0A179G312_METCM|nr:vacuolar iron transporter Ccc1 [Pochonia chlamydosporia 170]OAQ72262.1 vacuolar iron transporter Ccc1 [Pochonia chlamydosporia 170]
MPKSKSPCLTRFLSDFTLGFSDGLTVPFALTAGLSSLGRADTVIYAGLAELCAGSISMGIGGYLSALDEVPSSSGSKDELDSAGDEEELRGMLRDGSSRGSTSNLSDSIDEKDMEQESGEDLIRSHLEPLALPNTTVLEILATLRNRPDGVARSIRRLEQYNAVTEQPSDQLPIWPVASGLSISLGYVVGGIIPLFPYFFTSTVGKGLQWSIAMCLIALMAFGSGKSWVLRGEDRSIKRSLWEGLQMLILGTLAAGAAVLCVNLVGAGSEPGQ